MTNVGYRQSGVKIRLRLICTELYTGPQSTDGNRQLEDFRRHKGGSVPNVLGTADVAVLLVDRFDGNLAGIAYLDAPRLTVGAVKNHGYSSFYTFGHEVSHLLGAHHDRRTLNGRRPAYEYGVGNLIPGTRKHTIMA